jgi:hypothetical protein
MAALSTEARAARRLLDEKEELARMLTARLYAELPELDGRYGESGRVRCLEDMRFNVEHLAPAVELGLPVMFRSYVRWLDGLLRARNVATAEVVRTLHLMQALVRERFDEAEAAAIEVCIRAGLDELAAGDA